jgi:transposase
VRSALEWAQVRTLAAEGLSQREIARRLGINRRTVVRLACSDEPPRYRRPALGAQLDPLEPVLRRLVEEWPQIKAPRVAEILRLEHGFGGSERLVREHLRRLRPSSVRPAQRAGYRPGQVLRLDWAEMPTRPRIAGRERRVYALVAALPYSAAQTAHFSFELTLESFLEGQLRAFEFFGGVARECGYDNVRSVVARREREQVVWNQRFLHLRGHYAFHSSACTPETPREKGSVEAAVRHLKSGFWPARRFRDLRELNDQYVDWRDRVCNVRIHASGRFPVAERLAEERQVLRPLPPARFDWSRHRSVRVPIDGYVNHGRCFYRAPERLVHERVELRFDRDEVWIVHRGVEAARDERSYEQGLWLPPPIMRTEPPAPPRPAVIAPVAIAPPELREYAELCA